MCKKLFITVCLPLFIVFISNTYSVAQDARAIVKNGFNYMRGKSSFSVVDMTIHRPNRVAVARAIVSNPSIVLADEPTANLDSKTGNGLLEMMKNMNKEKKVTFIFSTHDNMVMDYARRLVLIRDGRIVDDQTK